jgi:multiple sugar transport system ATP-binding protein
LELYKNPRNKFVAGFIGSPAMNFLQCAARINNGALMLEEGRFTLHLATPTVQAWQQTKPQLPDNILLGIRPEDIFDLRSLPDAPPVFTATVELVEQMGNEIFAQLSTGRHELTARLPADLSFNIGASYQFGVNLDRCHLFDPQTEAALLYRGDAARSTATA